MHRQDWAGLLFGSSRRYAVRVAAFGVPYAFGGVLFVNLAVRVVGADGEPWLWGFLVAVPPILFAAGNHGVFTAFVFVLPFVIISMYFDTRSAYPWMQPSVLELLTVSVTIAAVVAIVAFLIGRILARTVMRASSGS